MKKLFLFLFLANITFSLSAEVRVLSNVKIGEGYLPRFANSETITYLQSSAASYIDKSNDDAELWVDNEDLCLNLYQNGIKTVLTPHGNAVNYIWSSLSPDKKHILFNTKYGTGICDLFGNELINFGQGLSAPVWFGNDYIVGMNDEHDGYHFTASSIVIASIDGSERKVLTNPAEMGFYPDVDAKSGRIVYGTESGSIQLLQLNLTEEPIRTVLPKLIKQLDGSLLNQIKRQAKRAASTNPADYRIYINPGHGGYDSDDRRMALYPVFINGFLNEAGGYSQEQTFWESQSNLDKGMRLDTLLHDLGFQTKMSRITNTTADDRSLSGIVAEANAWKSDFMLSIHSNAGNPSNYILQIHSGISPDDERGLTGYEDVVPKAVCDEARAITTLLGSYQYKNIVSCWSREPMIAGDKTFAREIMKWKNGYGVLRWLNVPGTISEGMMHDYLPETYRLMNIDYKRQESFYFAKTFIEHFCGKTLPYGAIGGKIHDDYQKQVFPNYRARSNTRDVLRPINRGVVELWQDDKRLQTYVTDTMYNGCYFFWNLQPGTYTVKALAEGYYPQEQTLEVKNNEISYGIFALSMARETPPEVIDYSPKVEITDSVPVATNVTISFNWDMEEESTAAALSFSPAVEGTITFEDANHTMRFTPATRFEPGVEYTVTLGTGASHPDKKYENHLQAPFSFKFRTANRGSVRLLQTYPAENGVDVPVNASFIALFDAQIVPSIIKRNVEILDANGKSVKINTRSFNCNTIAAPYGYVAFELVDELMPNAEYSLVLKPGISDTEGVLLNETMVIPFRTGKKSTSTLPLVDQMESKFFEGDKENSTDVESVNVMQYNNKIYAGDYSNQLAYVFSAPGGEALFNAIDPTRVIGNDNSKLGMYVFGDYSFNELYARWAVEGDIQYTKLCDLNYAGWLYQEADMSTLPAGVDYQFMGLRLVCVGNVLSNSGALYIDNLHAQYVGGGNTATEDVVIPNKHDGKFIEDGYLHILLNGVKYNVLGAHVE